MKPSQTPERKIIVVSIMKKTLLVQCKYVADRWLFLLHAICALNLILKYFCHLNPGCS